MSLAIRRKVLYLFAAAALALLLASATINAPVFAECTNSSSPTCSG